jgi:single-strand DNA-binding protein
MAASNINRVTVTGNLTRDPELRSIPSGTSVCKLRIAVNTRRKDASGQWVDKPNYFDVTVWGQQGENCANYLQKGRPVAIDGRLEWREWDATDGSGKRSAVEIVADTVQFLGGRGDDGGGNGHRFTPESDVPADTADFAPAPAGPGAADDDIPFEAEAPGRLIPCPAMEGRLSVDGTPPTAPGSRSAFRPIHSSESLLRGDFLWNR